MGIGCPEALQAREDTMESSARKDRVRGVRKNRITEHIDLSDAASGTAGPHAGMNTDKLCDLGSAEKAAAGG